MIWIGMAIGVVASFTVFSIMLIMVKRSPAEMPAKMLEFWEASLTNQRNLIHATVLISDVLEERLASAPDVDKMVDRFLAWPLPADFCPDGGVAFERKPDALGNHMGWPTGTNLLTASQARQMFEHVLKAE